MIRLKELRKEKGLTQIELSEELAIPLRTLQSWENEESQIKNAKVEMLANYFNVSPSYLLGYNEHDPKRDSEKSQLKEMYSKLETMKVKINRLKWYLNDLGKYVERQRKFIEQMEKELEASKN